MGCICTQQALALRTTVPSSPHPLIDVTVIQERSGRSVCTSLENISTTSPLPPRRPPPGDPLQGGLSEWRPLEVCGAQPAQRQPPRLPLEMGFAAAKVHFLVLSYNTYIGPSRKLLWTLKSVIACCRCDRIKIGILKPMYSHLGLQHNSAHTLCSLSIL